MFHTYIIYRTFQKSASDSRTIIEFRHKSNGSRVCRFIRDYSFCCPLTINIILFETPCTNDMFYTYSVPLQIAVPFNIVFFFLQKNIVSLHGINT